MMCLHIKIPNQLKNVLDKYYKYLIVVCEQIGQ